jgi:hypothetical protein
MLMTASRLIGVALVVVASVACTSDGPIMPAGHGPIVSACAQAFQTAVAVHGRDRQESDFDAAIANCPTFADWTRAVAANPDALGADAMEFLRDRCRHSPALEKAVICAPLSR